MSSANSDDLDNLLEKEDEIARLLTALVRIQGVLRPADNTNNVETVGRAMEIISALAHRSPSVSRPQGNTP